jgi:hypothetical protein
VAHNRQLRIGVAEAVGEHMGLTSSNILLNASALLILPDVLNDVYREYVQASQGSGQVLVEYERILVPENGGYRVRIFFADNGELSLTREWFPQKDR